VKLTAAQITNGDVNNAAEKFFTTDPSDLSALLQSQDPTRWDNTAFSAGRYGEEGNSGGIPSRSCTPPHYARQTDTD
jgi:hypothetical protein